MTNTSVLEKAEVRTTGYSRELLAKAKEFNIDINDKDQVYKLQYNLDYDYDNPNKTFDNDTRKQYDRRTKLTQEEGYELIKYYVQQAYYGREDCKKLHAWDVDEIANTIFISCVKGNYFNKYDGRITTKRHFISNRVNMRLMDFFRAYDRKVKRECSDQVQQDGEKEYSLIDTKAMNKVIPQAYEMFSTQQRDYLMSLLPTTPSSKLVGIVPPTPHNPGKHCYLSPRSIAGLVEEGYSCADIAKFFINPKTNKPISSSRVYTVVQQIREILQPALNED